MNAKTLRPRTRIDDHAEDLVHAAQSIIADLKTEASSRFQDVKKKADFRFSDAQDTASDAIDQLKGFIKEHPFAVVGFGVAAGLLLAAFARKS